MSFLKSKTPAEQLLRAARQDAAGVRFVLEHEKRLTTHDIRLAIDEAVAVEARDSLKALLHSRKWEMTPGNTDSAFITYLFKTAAKADKKEIWDALHDYNLTRTEAHQGPFIAPSFLTPPDIASVAVVMGYTHGLDRSMNKLFDEEAAWTGRVIPRAIETAMAVGTPVILQNVLSYASMLMDDKALQPLLDNNLPHTRGDVAKARELLHAGANPDSAGGWTALVQAEMNREHGLRDFLIAKGADVRPMAEDHPLRARTPELVIEGLGRLAAAREAGPAPKMTQDPYPAGHFSVTLNLPDNGSLKMIFNLETAAFSLIRRKHDQSTIPVLAEGVAEPAAAQLRAAVGQVVEVATNANLVPGKPKPCLK